MTRIQSRRDTLQLALGASFGSLISSAMRSAAAQPALVPVQMGIQIFTGAVATVWIDNKLPAKRGLAVDFLGWVSIHGVTEFGAIILCGAGGLVIAQNILFPGRYSRVDNLAAHGRSAAQLAVGAVFMFFIAGLIEGGMRQLVADTSARFAIGALTGVAWLAYFLLAGRRGQT